MRQSARFWLFIISSLVLAYVCLFLAPTSNAPTDSPPHWTWPLPVALDCREDRDDGLSLRSWPRATARGVSVAGILPDELVSDGDLLWISTQRGLIRLDTRSFQCVIFTQAAGISLSGAYALLPDGQGGLWASTARGLLYFLGGRWELVYSTQPGWYAMRISEVGLRQDGNFCVGLIGGRSGGPVHFCFSAASRSPQPGAGLGAALDNTDCSQWRRAASAKPRVSDWGMDKRFYDYLTLAECRQLAATEAYEFSAVLADGAEIWGVKDRRLFHHQDEKVKEIAMPYKNVQALAADSSGGAWMATERGLVHVQSGAQYVFQPFAFTSGLLALEDDFPGNIRSLAVDQTGQVWAATFEQVLRYDQAERAWRQALPGPTADYGVNFMLAADPVRGVWIAGSLKLLHWDGARWYAWPMPAGKYRSPTALLVDASGRVWLGTSHTSVWMAALGPYPHGGELPPLDWRQFTIQDGLADERITALELGSDGRVYAGHHAGVSVFIPCNGDFVNRVQAGRWTTLPGSDLDDGRIWVNALAFDQARGDLWVGYHVGKTLRRYQDGRWTEYPLPFTQHSIGALLVDDEGALWVGSAQGLWRWPLEADGTRSQSFKPDSHDPFIYEVLTLAQPPAGGDENDEGRIWVGGREGVAVLLQARRP